jgi:hypothetical protein
LGGDYPAGTYPAALVLGNYTASFPDEIITHAIDGSADRRSTQRTTGSYAAGEPYIVNVKDAGGGTDIYLNGITVNNDSV